MSFREGMAKVWIRNKKDKLKYGYIDKSGREVVPCKYTDISDSFYEGMAWVKVGSKTGFMDKTGRWVIQW